jgi:hypothetical protein
MSKENSVNKVTTPREQPLVALPDWLKFPTLAEVFDESLSKMIAHLTAMHKEYQALEANGTAADRVRSRLISASYARTCVLLQELEAMQAVPEKK